MRRICRPGASAHLLLLRRKTYYNLFFIPPGHKVYQLDICDAIKYQMGCPGFTTLSAGGVELGPVARTCKCHKKLMTEN